MSFFTDINLLIKQTKYLKFTRAVSLYAEKQPKNETTQKKIYIRKIISKGVYSFVE